MNMDTIEAIRDCMKIASDEYAKETVDYAKKDNLTMAYFSLGTSIGILEALDAFDNYVDVALKTGEINDASDDEETEGIDGLIESIEKFTETCKLTEEDDEDDKEKSDFELSLEKYMEKLKTEEDEYDEQLRALLEKLINDVLFSGKSVAKVQVRTKE